MKADIYKGIRKQTAPPTIVHKDRKEKRVSPKHYRFLVDDE